MEEFVRQHARQAARQAAEHREQRLAAARAQVREHDRDPNTYIVAARTLKQAGELYEALDLLRTGLARCPPSPELYEYYIERLEKCNQTEAAIEAAQKAMQLFPDKLIFRLREALLLPVFYDSQRQIELYRDRFTAGLHRLISEVPLATTIEAERALEAISRNSNKYLPYQGQNDRELQVLYGTWVHRIMTANFPGYGQPLPLPAIDDKIRVGYLTSQAARFLGTSAEKLFAAWIREHDRSKFEVFAYHADRLARSESDQVKRWNICFRQLSGDLAEITQAVLDDQLHVLVFMDFAMHPKMAQLSALRLAPIQCVTWDIPPMTSGMPTMDFFISSDLMEPENAQDHYLERLVRLPGVGVTFAKPVIPRVLLQKKRNDFGLREDAVIYLSCQTVFKYLPEQDSITAKIAKRVPNSQFVFLVTNEVVEADFKKRMAGAFASVGLDSSERCVWLPEMDLLDFWNLNLVGDVALDPLSWSGGVTTFEAVACGLPVVTLPGKLMRARHSYAILTQLGVSETIAPDVNAYVEIATRLGTDRHWRQGILDRMMAGFVNLYSDVRSIRALENFYRGTISQRTGSTL